MAPNGNEAVCPAGCGTGAGGGGNCHYCGDITYIPVAGFAGNPVDWDWLGALWRGPETVDLKLQRRGKHEVLHSQDAEIAGFCPEKNIEYLSKTIKSAF